MNITVQYPNNFPYRLKRKLSTGFGDTIQHTCYTSNKIFDRDFVSKKLQGR